MGAAASGRTRDTTREAIIKATEALIAEDSSLHLTVTQISQRAGISRQTFYRHFEDVPHALRELVAHMAEELAELDAQSTEQGGQATERMVLVFTVLGSHRPFLRSLLRDERLPAFMFRFWDLYNERYLYPSLGLSEPMRKVSRFTAGGLVSLIQDWIADEHPKSPEEMVQEFRGLVLQSIELFFP